MTNNTQKDSFSDFVRNPSPETSEIMRKAADSSQKKMDDMVKDVKLDTQTDWEKHKVWAKTIANMVYGFNGSDKNNPPVKGLDGATQTLEDILADARREGHEESVEEMIEALRKPLQWIVSNDTGVSSKTIWSVIMGVEPDYADVPADEADYGRCIRLLQLIPQWQSRLNEVVDKYPEWKEAIKRIRATLRKEENVKT